MPVSSSRNTRSFTAGFDMPIFLASCEIGARGFFCNKRINSMFFESVKMPLLFINNRCQAYIIKEISRSTFNYRLQRYA